MNPERSFRILTFVGRGNINTRLSNLADTAQANGAAVAEAKGMRKLKGMFGTSAKGQHHVGVLDLPGVQVAETSEDLYQTVRQLGFGQTATVHEGLSRANGRRYALKGFTSDFLRSDPDVVRALRIEAETLRQLGSHRFVVGLHEVVSTPSFAYLVMELVSGGDLLSPIEKKGPYSEPKAQRVFAQISHALRHLHSVGVVHRDLKPENICFTTPDLQWIKLIDLGAAGFDSPEGLTELCGTPLYAAPEVTPWYWVRNDEQAQRCRRYGREVDCWSAGITLFVMLTGEAPFEQEQPVERLLQDVCNAPIDLSGAQWRRISPQAKHLVQGLLTRVASRRTTVDEMRSHPWLSDAMQKLEEHDAAAGVGAGGGPLLADAPSSPAGEGGVLPRDDWQVLSALAYLPHCADMSREGGHLSARRPMGDVRLLVLPDAGCGPLHTHTIRLTPGGVYVLPGRQPEHALCVAPCTRAQLLRWVTGEGAFCPQGVEVDPRTSLGQSLRCFAPTSGGFKAYCRERGIVPLTASAPAAAAATATVASSRRPSSGLPRMTVRTQPPAPGPATDRRSSGGALVPQGVPSTLYAGASSGANSARLMRKLSASRRTKSGGGGGTTDRAAVPGAGGGGLGTFEV